MDVKELLPLISGLSIGLDEPTSSDIPIYLRYLNLAYFEILRGNILKNPLLKKKRETLTYSDGAFTAPSEHVFGFQAVYTLQDKIPLAATNLDKILETDVTVSLTGQPTCYYYDNDQVNIYPLYTGDIGILYAPVPDRLTINSLSADIKIPDVYLSVLVDGTSYYLFQAEAAGFKNANKMMETKERWLKSKVELANYLKALGGQNYYSTYSPV